MEFLLPALLAAVVTALTIPLLEHWAGAMHLLDQPGERKVHDRPIPRVGGMAMASGAALALVFWLPLDRLAIAYLAGALIVLLFGVWDDRGDLPAGVKLLGQTLAVGLVVLGGGVEVHSLTLAERIELPATISLPLTFLFLVGVTNAINLADGLDGLAGGTTLLCFVAIAALSLGHDAPFVTIISMTMTGSLLGFLRFNSYPARVFMGDGGSQLLGFTVGVTAVVLTQDERLPYSAALPVLLLGLPILDTLTVMARRIAEGQSPFRADARHLHHRLLARGFDHFESVALIYCLQAALFILAWVMRHERDYWILAAFFAFAAAVLYLLLLGKRSGWTWRGVSGMHFGLVIVRRLPWIKRASHLPRWGNVVVWICLSSYLVGLMLFTTAVSADVAWLASGLALILLCALLGLGSRDAVASVAHGATFVAVVMAVYLDHIEPTKLPAFTMVKWTVFPLLVAAVLVRLRFWRERRFEITTLDVLVVFMALVLPSLPGLRYSSSDMALSIMKLVALLYATEMLLAYSSRVRRWTWGITAVALAGFALRGLGLPVGQ